MRAIFSYLSMLLLLSLMSFGPMACSSAQQEQGLQGEEQSEQQEQEEQEQEQQEQEEEEEQQQQEEQEEQQQQQQEQEQYDDNAELENGDLNGNEGQQASEDGDNEGFNNQLQNSDDELQQIMEQENAGNELDANQQDFEQNLQQDSEQMVDNYDQENNEQAFGEEQQMVEEEPMEQVMNQGEEQMVDQPVQENTMVDSMPAAASAPTGNLPEMGTTMSYIVERGDTLGKIATKIYGDIGKWREVMQLSNLADPNKIYPGDVVYYQLDEQSTSFAQAYENTPKSSTTVQPGDTLAKIATNVYGNSGAWVNIWRQNDWINDPTQLVVGKTIYYINPGQIIAALKSLRESAKNTFAYAKKALEQATEDTLDITVEFVHNG